MDWKCDENKFMVVGKGLIGTAFKKYFENDDDVLVFATGVSNSKERRSDEYKREKELLLDHLSYEKYTIYFSSCSVGDPELKDTHYVEHKREMEEIMISLAKDYSIFRLPQVVGKTPNPFTLTNYLYSQITTGLTFQVWKNATRNLIDVEDVASIVSELIKNQNPRGLTLNIATPFYTSIPQLVKIFEIVTGKEASYTEVDAGGTYQIDSTLALEAASKIGINFDESYNQKLIRKYYG